VLSLSSLIELARDYHTSLMPFYKSASFSRLFESGKPIDELRRKRLQKVYEEYYKPYNKISRPIQEKAPERTINGLAQWME
jgi:hypothetical protein